MPGYFKDFQQINSQPQSNTQSPNKEKVFFGRNQTDNVPQRTTSPQTNMLSQFMMNENDMASKSIGFSDKKSKRSSGNLKRRRDPTVKEHQNKPADDPGFENFE